MKKRLNNHQEIYVAKKYQKGYSTPEIARIFDIGITTIHRILKKRKVKIRTNSEANKLSMKKYPNRKWIIKNIETPLVSEDFENEAEIVGIMLGDGHIHKNGYYIRLKVRETEFIKNFSDLIKKTYGLEPINKILDYPCSFVHSKLLTRRLISLTKNNKEIPRFILHGTNKIKARFLRGFFDAEGSVDIIYNRRQIVLTQNNLHLLKQIKELLLDIGIQSKIYQKKYGSDKLYISLLENLDKYQQLIGFSIKYKEQNLKKAVEYLKKCKSHEKEKYWEILRHWLKSKKSLRSSAKEVGLNWETYRTWIYGMQMPNQIKKDIEYGLVPEDYEELSEQYDFLPVIQASE